MLIKEKIIKLLKDTSLSYAEISRKLNCSYTHVRETAVVNGIIREKKKSEVIKILKDNPEMCYHDISDITNYGVCNVCTLAKQNNLARHTKVKNSKYKKVLTYLKDGLYSSFSEVAHICNVNYSYVYRISKKEKIDNRQKR